MPLNPEVMETTDSNGNTIELKFEPSSIIGFSTNGVVAYNALEAGSANAVEPGEGHVPDAQWWFGHADAKNVHHYHAPWLGRDDYETMGGDVHLGYAMDGFPIYGPLSNPDEVLDDCNFDKVNKRYHIRKLSQVDNNLDYCNGNSEAVNWKYIVGCFRGNVRKTLVKDNTSDKAIVHSDCVREN